MTSLAQRFFLALRRALCSFSSYVTNSNDYALAKRPGRSSDGIESYRNVLRVQEAIKLRPAGVKLLCHCLFGLALLEHGLFELPRQHPLNGDRFDFLPNPFFFEKAVKGRTTVAGYTATFSYFQFSPL